MNGSAELKRRVHMHMHMHMKTHANQIHRGARAKRMRTNSLPFCTAPCHFLSAGCSRSRRRVGRPSVWSCVLEPSTASSPPQNLVKTTRILDVRRNKATEARLSPSSAPTHQTAQNTPQPTHRCCDSSQQVRLQWVLAGNGSSAVFGQSVALDQCRHVVWDARCIPHS